MNEFMFKCVRVYICVCVCVCVCEYYIKVYKLPNKFILHRTVNRVNQILNFLSNNNHCNLLMRVHNSKKPFI